MNIVTHISNPLPFVRRLEEGISCCNCGWPIKHVSTAMVSHRNEDGEKVLKHCMCPGLKERARMRAEALENA